VIQDICTRQGCSLGKKIKRKLPDNRLSTVATTFAKSFDPNLVKVVSVSDSNFHIQGTKCPFGLENTSRELCEAVMSIDHEYFRTALSGDIRMVITKTMAAGDSFCETIYDIPESCD
jgi:hypothetical protein